MRQSSIEYYVREREIIGLRRTWYPNCGADVRCGHPCAPPMLSRESTRSRYALEIEMVLLGMPIGLELSIKLKARARACERHRNSLELESSRK
jgi:hypothetical protein